jgi:hypothetical protein
MVTAGLPFPGCPEGAFVDVLLLLEPHAAKPTANATAANTVDERFKLLGVIFMPVCLLC